MLKTLDILIGATTVVLLFSMAVTIITQAITSLAGKRGEHLLAGLTGLLQQLGIPTRDLAGKVATALLHHPTLTTIEGDLATVIHRGEFTKLLMDIAGGQQLVTLEPDALAALKEMLADNGVPDPAQTLSNIRRMALLIETANPSLASHVREELAILQESATDYVAKINAWFDQTMDRVSQSFTQHAHRVTVVAAFVVVVVVQLDIIGVVNRLTVDQQFRDTVVSGAVKSVNDKSSGPNNAYNLDTNSYYNMLFNAGLITLPTSHEWIQQISDYRKYPGMILAIALISLGAPFWYNVLKDLIGLRSTLAQNDDQQRAQRQTSQTPSGSASSNLPDGSGSLPDWLRGERGQLPAS